MTVRDLHRWNGVFLMGFIVMHMATHVSGVFGIDAYNNTQAAMRLVYRNILVEPLVLGSAVGQIVLGGWVLVRRARAGLRGRWANVQAWSGAAVLIFMIQHLIGFSLARWVDGLDTTFYWPASVMSDAPFVWYFGPYYFVGVTALFVHLGCACRLVLMRRGWRRWAAGCFWGLSGLGAGIASVIVVMLLGGFYAIDLPAEWVGYLQKFIPGYRL